MSLPKRWLPYNPVGKPIPGTPFVAFKVPLKERLCQRVPPEDRFSPEVLLKMLPNLTVVVDLTFTNRYYDSHSEFTKRGVQYRKVAIPGKEVPRNKIVNKFFEVVDSALATSSPKGHLIGVHCTHGVNRTGYLICKYMIHRLGINPDEAIRLFEDARGYKIERENYLDDLRQRDSNQVSQDRNRNVSPVNRNFANRFSHGNRGRQWNRDDRRRPNEFSAPVERFGNNFSNRNWRMSQEPDSNSRQPENRQKEYPYSNSFNSRKTEDFRRSNFTSRDDERQNYSFQSRQYDRSNTGFSHRDQETREQNNEMNLYDSKPVESRDSVFRFSGNKHFSGNSEPESPSYGKIFKNNVDSFRTPEDRFTDSYRRNNSGQGTDSYRRNSSGVGTDSWRQNKRRWESNSSGHFPRRDTFDESRERRDNDSFRARRSSERNSVSSNNFNPDRSANRNDNSAKSSYDMRSNKEIFYPNFSRASNTNNTKKTPIPKIDEPKFYKGYVALPKKYNENGDRL